MAPSSETWFVFAAERVLGTERTAVCDEAPFAARDRTAPKAPFITKPDVFSSADTAQPWVYRRLPLILTTILRDSKKKLRK